MQKKLLLFSLLAAGSVIVARAQFSEFQNNAAASTFTLSSDQNTLQIGGRTSFYYEDRVMKQGNVNLSHNGFNVGDMDIDLLGKTANKFIYEFHLSPIDLVTAAATQNTSNPANSGIKAAYLQYVGFLVHIKLGFDKVPFSQGSLTEKWASPMWSHANLYGGDYFSRRDIGLTLNTNLMNNRLHLYGGMYSGLGENCFEYGGDASGKPEFIGRAEYSYPGKMKYASIDEENSPVVNFRVALNARYMDKTQPAGHSVATDVPDAPGAFGLRIVDGKRSVYGGDFIIKYRGLSFLFETDMVNIQPTSTADPLYEGTATSVNKNKVNAGGFTTSLNYNLEKLHSCVTIMYETLNPNDLAPGHEEWLYLGYAYKLSGFNSVFKIEYYRPMVEDVVSDPLKYTAQIRAGYQIVF